MSGLADVIRPLELGLAPAFEVTGWSDGGEMLRGKLLPRAFDSEAKGAEKSSRLLLVSAVGAACAMPSRYTVNWK